MSFTILAFASGNNFLWVEFIVHYTLSRNCTLSRDCTLSRLSRDYTLSRDCTGCMDV